MMRMSDLTTLKEVAIESNSALKMVDKDSITDIQNPQKTDLEYDKEFDFLFYF